MRECDAPAPAAATRRRVRAFDRQMDATCDALIIGGGFYGCSLAILLAETGGRVIVVEREEELLTRASYRNQARVHQGYHYPRSFLTGLRSAMNFNRFVGDFLDAIDREWEHVYGIARIQSRTNAFQFRKFCERIGAPLRPAPPSLRRLFNSELIEEVFVAREYAFNAVALRNGCRAGLERGGVEVRLGRTVERVTQTSSGLRTLLADGEAIDSREVFNCTYSGINTVLKNSGLPLLGFKHEITELALIEMPPALREIGITIMDGPFFSSMPFPARGLHSLSHVRYTPHRSWRDLDGHRDGYDELTRRKPRSNFEYMLADARRFLPAIAAARHVDSLFEIKTVLIRNEVDDGRPILWRPDHGLKGLHVLMGGKIDNVYDILREVGAMSAAPA